MRALVYLGRRSEAETRAKKSCSAGHVPGGLQWRRCSAWSSGDGPVRWCAALVGLSVVGEGASFRDVPGAFASRQKLVLLVWAGFG